MARRPTSPPFKVGEKVKYNSVVFGKGEPTRWLEKGEIGIVVAVHPAQASTGLMLDDGDGGRVRDEGLDGWSRVRYLDDPAYDRAVDAKAVREGLFERVG
jgi:hypothetical protein